MNSSTSSSDRSPAPADGRLRYGAAMASGARRAAGLLLLAAVVAAGCLALLHRVYFVRDFQVRAVEALGPETAVLFIGSSRFYYGINPALYGGPGHTVTLAADYLDHANGGRLWGRHRDTLPGLRLLVLEFGMVSLRLDAATLAPQSLLNLGVFPWPAPADWLSDPAAALRRLLVPLYRWRLTPAFMKVHRRQVESPDERLLAEPGHVPSMVRLAAPALSAERNLGEGEELLSRFPAAVYDRNLAALVETVRDAAARKIKVVLLRMPKEGTLRGMYPGAWHRVVHDSYRDLGRRLDAVGTGIPEFWDESDGTLIPTEGFRDPDHLNSEGARLFAGQLGPKLLKTLASP